MSDSVSRMLERTDYHIGRRWTGHEIEDECPCEQAACGLVPWSGINIECPHHSLKASKSMRQGHPLHACPGGAA